jgi:serine protease AprX
LVRGGKDVFLSDDHGTQALSCITAKYNDQVIGTGYGADISLYITEDVRDEYKIEEYNWVIAAEKADSAGVDIISSSLGYDAFFDNASMNYKVSQLDGETAVITRGAEMASDRGILVVTSSGNEFDLQVWDLISFPADGKKVLSVGSVKGDRTKSGFSLGGPTADGRIKPEVVALGSSTTVIDADGRITTSSGTSFSCPLITGFAAGLWQANPYLTNVELRQLIMDSSSQSNNPDNLLGYGIPNYNVAMGNVLGLGEINQDQVEIYPNPLTNNLLKINFGQAVFYNELTINLYDSQGHLFVSRQERNILSDSILELELPDLDKGIYILSFVGMENHKGIKLLKF